jgi:hypothetical protein
MVVHQLLSGSTDEASLPCMAFVSFQYVTHTLLRTGSGFLEKPA